MSKLVVVSPAGIWNEAKKQPYPQIIDALKKLRESGHRVVCLSSHNEPAWWAQYAKPLQYMPVGFNPPRRSGKVIPNLLSANKDIHTSDVIVLGVSEDDFLMAVNSQSILLRCEWGDLCEKIKNYGVPVITPDSLPKILKLLSDKAPWHFRYESDELNVYALTQAGTIRETDPDFLKIAQQWRECLKDNDQKNELAIQLHFMSSLYATDVFRTVDVWGYYPSSRSKNNGEETMARFCRSARTMFKKKGDEPLFIRHTPSTQRHVSGGNRTDPSDQIESIHLNPEYSRKIKGKSVAVLDDYLTYGASFGVAAALLKEAGAREVHCVAMGKFGKQAMLYDITLNENPYQAISTDGYELGTPSMMTGAHIDEAKHELIKKMK